MDTIKKIHSEVCVFDLECVPDIEAGRRLLADECFTRESDGMIVTAEEATDAQIAEKMIEQFANAKGILKTVLYKVVTIATVIRQVTSEGIKLSLRNITLSEERDERDVIRTFMTYLGSRRPQVVGYATSTFDFGVLWQRAIALGINVEGFTHRPAKPWDEYADYFSSKNDFNVDLLKVLGNNSDTMPRLAQIASVARIPCKLGGISGLSVLDLYLENKFDEIADYCEDDSCATYLVWLQCVASHGLLSDEQIANEKQLFIDMLALADKAHCVNYLNEYLALNDEHVEEIEQHSVAEDELDALESDGEKAVEALSEAKASMLADLITSKQLNMISAIAHEAKINSETVCFERFHCKLEELSKRAASDLIDILTAMRNHEMPKGSTSRQPKATQKQINFISVLKNDRKFDDATIEKMCRDSVQCSVDQLTRQTASIFIETLKNTPGDGTVVAPLFDRKEASLSDDEWLNFDQNVGSTRYRFRVKKSEVDAAVTAKSIFKFDAQKSTVTFLVGDGSDVRSTEAIMAFDAKLDEITEEDDIPF